jgi:two-component system NtrC family response regulator
MFAGKYCHDRFMALIIDDDAAVRTSLGFVVKRAGFKTEEVSAPDEALAFVRRMSPELVLGDMNFSMSTSDEEGIRLLRQVKVFCPDAPVILITAWGLSRWLSKNRSEADRKFHFEKIAGKSEALITGENGTGKELIAEAIHANLNWRKKLITMPFKAGY